MGFTRLYASTSYHEAWNGRCRYVQIFVYDTLREFQEVTGKKDAAGCFNPAPCRERFNEKTKKWERVSIPWAGVIRMNREHMNTEVVVHEATHAACHIYREDVESSIHLGTGFENLINEEKLAYIIGNLSAAVNNTLWEAGVFK